MFKRWLPVKFLDADGAGSGSGSENATGENKESESHEEKTYTQAEVNAMMAREKKQGKNSILKALGLSTVEEGRAAIDAGRNAANANKSEEQQASEALSAERTARTKAENDLTAANRKISVMKAGYNPAYVDDVVAVASTKVTEDKDFETVIEEMKTSHPFFLAGASANKEEEKKGTGGNAAGYKKDQGKKEESYGERLAKKQLETQKNVNNTKFFN